MIRNVLGLVAAMLMIGAASVNNLSEYGPWKRKHAGFSLTRSATVIAGLTN
jgi:hypothetical protein